MDPLSSVASLASEMVYDVLVGEAARAKGRTLITRDRRASTTYGLLGVHYVMLD